LGVSSEEELAAASVEGWVAALEENLEAVHWVAVGVAAGLAAGLAAAMAASSEAGSEAVLAVGLEVAYLVAED
jgi:hypothetical protein